MKLANVQDHTVPCIHKCFRNVSDCLVQDVYHSGITPPDEVLDEKEFVYIRFRGFDWRMNVLECHAQEKWLGWIMRSHNLLHPLKPVEKKNSCYSGREVQ